MRERDVAAAEDAGRRRRTSPAHRFIYFKYASDEVNKELTPKSELDALRI